MLQITHTHTTKCDPGLSPFPLYYYAGIFQEKLSIAINFNLDSLQLRMVKVFHIGNDGPGPFSSLYYYQGSTCREGQPLLADNFPLPETLLSPGCLLTGQA